MLKIRDLEMLENIDLVYKNKIVLYGAGDYGHRALRLLGQLEIPIYGICDSNESLWGGVIKGHKILSIQELIEICNRENVSIIMTMANPNSVEQVIKMLDHYGLLDVECYTYFALKAAIEIHINDCRISDTFRGNFNKAKAAYIKYALNNIFTNNKLRCAFEVMLYDPILIWQPGKVGSSTIAKSLGQRNIRFVHIHDLRQDNYESTIDYNNRLSLLRNLEKVQIISLVRDPIARSISHYFEHWHLDGYSLFDASFDESNLNMYQRIIAFTEREAKTGQYGFMFDWFNQEIKEILDIDIYQHDFDKNKGYQFIYQDNIELLLIKTEKLNDCQEVIGKFVGADNFKLVNKNVGNQKPYKFVYEAIKKSFRIPEHIINFYYKGNKAMDHFYTSEEKENFIKKWSRDTGL